MLLKQCIDLTNNYLKSFILHTVPQFRNDLNSRSHELVIEMFYLTFRHFEFLILNLALQKSKEFSIFY